MLLISDIVYSHDTGYHLYVDDTQLFQSCDKPTCLLSVKQTLPKLTACIADILQCMPQNGLKLNDNKAKYLLLNSKNLAKITPSHITIGDDAIPPPMLPKI